MPKMRGFKPELWTDDKFVELTPLARLLFMGMWTYSCDNGHLDDKPKQIKMRVLPTDDCDPAELVQEMVDLSMVIRTPDNGLWVRKLREHQRIDDRYFTWCDRCEPDEIPEKAREKHAGATQGARRVPTGARSEPTLKEGEGRKEGEGESEGSATSPGDDAATPPAKKKADAKKRAHRLPDDWRPTDAHLERCNESGLDPAHELAKFQAHAEANDRRQASWNAAFTQWLLNARPSPSNVRQFPKSELLPDRDGNLVLPPLPKGVFEQ